MSRVRYTRRAREDLLSLWAHLAPLDPAAADRVYDRIEESCGRLRQHPELGPARPKIGEGARMLVIGRWLALYRLMEDGVQVVRIVDGARDLAQVGWTVDE